MLRLRQVFLSCFLVVWAASWGHCEAEKIRVASYNLRNYLAMDRLVDGQFRLDYPKPESEKAVVRKSILLAAPDILAVQEIGSKEELDELRDDLAAEGLVYQSLYVLEAHDDTRRIGALWKSKLKVEPREHEDLEFTLFNQRQSVKRGMLELKVEWGPESDFSVFILHLKSKYTTDKRDPQSTKRRTLEAQAARDRILDLCPDPSAGAFLVVGDLNDHRNSSPVRRLLVRGDLQISQILEVKDSSGLIWTHYYKKGGEYSLLDYMLASPGLSNTFETASGIGEVEDYYEGSDHRLVWTDLTLKN